MRCTRCDRIAVPQALGRLPDGRLAFGLCVRCLTDEGCEAIRIGPRHGRHPRRLRPRAPAHLADLSRRRGLRALAGLLAAWGVTLALVGATFSRSRLPRSPLGNGSPILLLTGAAAMALLALALGYAARRASIPPPRGGRGREAAR